MWILEISRQGQLQTETLFIQTGRYFGVPMVAFCLEYILKNTLMLLCDIVFVPHESSLLYIYILIHRQEHKKQLDFVTNTAILVM